LFLERCTPSKPELKSNLAVVALGVESKLERGKPSVPLVATINFPTFFLVR
tara:strand:- start:745 stop:897 length:153 start_codon:yes stop_codon:yes gene_type:complete